MGRRRRGKESLPHNVSPSGDETEIKKLVNPFNHYLVCSLLLCLFSVTELLEVACLPSTSGLLCVRL